MFELGLALTFLIAILIFLRFFRKKKKQKEDNYPLW